MNPNPILPILPILLAAGILSGCGKKPQAAQPATPPAAENATSSQPAPAVPPNPGFEKLKGKWLRPDGGYVIEISNVAAGGKLDATYANPNPIHVAKAEASLNGTTVTVFIELRDVNYPGSTYTLAYDPASDQLKGLYYQATQQQQFEVFFTRMK